MLFRLLQYGVFASCPSRVYDISLGPLSRVPHECLDHSLMVPTLISLLKWPPHFHQIRSWYLLWFDDFARPRLLPHLDTWLSPSLSPARFLSCLCLCASPPPTTGPDLPTESVYLFLCICVLRLHDQIDYSGCLVSGMGDWGENFEFLKTSAFTPA